MTSNSNDRMVRILAKIGTATKKSVTSPDLNNEPLLAIFTEFKGEQNTLLRLHSMDGQHFVSMSTYKCCKQKPFILGGVHIYANEIQPFA